eukprot:764451-Hanusia_phi.AAC.2
MITDGKHLARAATHGKSTHEVVLGAITSLTEAGAVEEQSEEEVRTGRRKTSSSAGLHLSASCRSSRLRHLLREPCPKIEEDLRDCDLASHAFDSISHREVVARENVVLNNSQQGIL